MGLAYSGVLSFPGTIGHIQLGLWNFDVKRTKFFGLIGTSEIPGGVGSRSIAVPYWLYDPSIAYSSDMDAALYLLDSYIGYNDTLVEDGTIERTFENTTFDGFELDKERGGPIFTNIGWLCIGVLHFTQLRPNGT